MTRPFRLTPPPISEDDVEAGCMSLLWLRRYKVYRLHVGIFQSMDGERTIYGAPKGTPDYICAHGVYRSFLLEVKRPGGKLRPDQEIEIALLREQFGLAIVVASSTDELGNFLARHERSP